ncbi:MAG TPA: hypothetical protein VFK41_06485 [Nocardioidaceae bacterium]|nr:hypothetical protein [Nocardioidaceae bacterium]
MRAFDKAVDAACKWAARALREGDSRQYVANVLEVIVTKAEAS